MQDVIQYYKKIMKENGYSFQIKYSGITPIEYFELNYYTFIKGYNSVVIFIKDKKA